MNKKIRLDLVDPLTKAEKNYVIGPLKVQDLIEKVCKLVSIQPPLRLRYFLMPEAYRTLEALCKEHHDTIRQSAVFTVNEFKMLDFLNFVELPAHLATEKT